MFTQAQEEEETKPDDVRKALVSGTATEVVAEDVVQDWCWKGLDLHRKRILLRVAAKLAQYAKSV